MFGSMTKFSFWTRVSSRNTHFQQMVWWGLHWEQLEMKNSSAHTKRASREHISQIESISHNQTWRGAAPALLGRLERMEQITALSICPLTSKSGITTLKDQESGIQTPNSSWISITGSLTRSSCLSSNSNKEGEKVCGRKDLILSFSNCNQCQNHVKLTLYKV